MTGESPSVTVTACKPPRALFCALFLANQLSITLIRRSARHVYATQRSSDEDFEYEDGEGDGVELRGSEEPAAAAGPAPSIPCEAPVTQPAASQAVPRGSRVSDLSRNGRVVGDSYLWSQSAAEVTLSVVVPPDTRARDVAVTLSRPPGPGGKHHRVRVTVQGSSVVDHHLAFPIQLADATSDAAEAEDIDWAVEDLDEAAPAAGEGQGDAAATPGDWPRRRPRRLVRVTLRKAGISGASEQGMVLWWNRCLGDHPGETEPIDTSSFADRQSRSQRNQQAQQAWAEAQAMFLERVKDPNRRILVG